MYKWMPSGVYPSRHGMKFEQIGKNDSDVTMAGKLTWRRTQMQIVCVIAWHTDCTGNSLLSKYHTVSQKKLHM